MSAANNSLFANDLYHQTSLIAGHGNLIVSPVCVQTVLGMLYIASCGRTADQMKKVLRIGSPTPETFAEGYQAQLQSVLSNNIVMANKIYVQKDYEIYQNYTDKVNRYFLSGVGNINFADNAGAAKEISGWVAAKTNNKIRNLLAPGDVSQGAKLMLVNTLTVSAKWRKPFLDSRTAKQDFYLSERDTVQVNMMSGMSFTSIGDVKELEAVALSLPCKGSDINLLVVLPNKKDGLSDLETKMANFDMQKIGDQMEETMVKIKLPKFEFESFFDLSKVLKKMGMEDAFSSAANFDGLSRTGNLAISNVYHKAVVKVNEVGLEASAATSVQMMRLMTRGSRLFNANHPFWFAIRNGDNILFTGRFVGSK